MKVLKGTTKQVSDLTGTYANGAEIRFVKDGNDNNIIGLEVLTDDDFIEIREQLLALTKSDYVKPKEDAS
jgi:hypothetical protein